MYAVRESRMYLSYFCIESKDPSNYFNNSPVNTPRSVNNIPYFIGGGKRGETRVCIRTEKQGLLSFSPVQMNF